MSNNDIYTLRDKIDNVYNCLVNIGEIKEDYGTNRKVNTLDKIGRLIEYTDLKEDTQPFKRQQEAIKKFKGKIITLIHSYFKKCEEYDAMVANCTVEEFNLEEMLLGYQKELNNE